MLKLQKFTLTAAILLSSSVFVFAQEKKSEQPAAASPDSKGTNKFGGDSSQRPRTPRKSQSDVASKTASFGKIDKTSEEFKKAIEAHALEEGMKLVGKTNSLKGTVSKIFEVNAAAILNFDPDYKTAMNGIVHSQDYTNFPDLKSLVGKEVLIAGKFIDYQGRAEIELLNPAQVKVVQGAAAK